MAGESPDRSKQRESSAGKTSGSASPVPEARSEAADPRLAVARDAEKSSARGGADTATRVLSTRTAEEPENSERPESDSDAERAASDSDAAGPGGAGSSDGEGGDGRLRDAVAAWVASADGEKEAAAEGDDEEPAAERAQKPGRADAGTREAGKADAGTPGGREAPEGPGEDAGASAGPDRGDEDGAVAAEAASEGSETGRDDADEPEADRSATAGTDTGSKAPDAEPEAKADDTDAEVTDAGSGSESEAKADDTEDDADAKVTDTEDDAAERAGDKGRAPADPRVSTGSKAAPKAGDAKTGDAETADDVEAAEDEPSATGTPEDKPATGKTPKTGETTGTPEDKPATGKSPKPGETTGSGSAAAGAREDGDAPAEPPVDQPTAVFKVQRPPVDQPTTMLKLGGAAKDLPKSDLPKTAAPKADAPTTDAPKKAAPEKDAERTSKFVALKHLDDPATRKPPAPPEATAPVPTVGPERTTQQPLPPKPPLDLLAELTNTPPPPDTPLRTAARRVKIWTPLVLLLVVVFAVVQSVRPLPTPTLELTAKDSYTFEGGKVDIPWPADGQAALDVQGIGTFGSSGEQKPVPIASVAKVMTAYLILRDHPLKSGEKGPKIDIDQAAQDQSDAGQESTVDVTKGDSITEREALESILIASANNIARLLARWDAGSEKGFVQKMNDAAKDLGMKNTTYTDPSGLNNTTVSTAVDQVKLARAAMQQPAFREVAAMMSYVDYKGTKHDNWNRLVGSNNVTGIKTGTTTSALGNLVFAARKDVDGETHRIIGAVVRQPAGGPDNTILGAALYEGDKLIRAAQGALESATILKKGDVVGYADDGLGGRTPVAVTEDVTAVGWAGLSVKLTFAGDDLPHTAKAGTKVGTLTVGDGTTSAVKVPVALQKELTEPGFGAKLTRIG
ncbi:D-alanyl-D-alanine carboxypeptidase [Streptomyces sp. NRRL B-1140]|uniref:D-alanyl-D-alanine carboxypeptidase n=1 Tax=Streptomyces sp. NRRL B-1140 TaxID=1415549 RepID=UPI0006AF59E8|nr:D-alanyl-D-alanine carboxypeptidase [Streptomyces sp. NRRL B-1140]